MPAAAFAARKPGKLSVVGSTSLLVNFQPQLLPLSKPDERPRNRAGIGVSRRRFGGGREELKSRRRRFEVENAFGRRSRRVCSRTSAKTPQGRRKAAAQNDAAGGSHAICPILAHCAWRGKC